MTDELTEKARAYKVAVQARIRAERDLGAAGTPEAIVEAARAHRAALVNEWRASKAFILAYRIVTAGAADAVATVAIGGAGVRAVSDFSVLFNNGDCGVDLRLSDERVVGITGLVEDSPMLYLEVTLEALAKALRALKLMAEPSAPEAAKTSDETTPFEFDICGTVEARDLEHADAIIAGWRDSLEDSHGCDVTCWTIGPWTVEPAAEADPDRAPIVDKVARKLSEIDGFARVGPADYLDDAHQIVELVKRTIAREATA